MTIFFTFVVATFATMVLIPPFVRLAAWMHATDLPGDRKVHTTPMPRLGGVAMAIGTVLPLLIWGDREPQLVAFLAGVAIILAFGVWDDVSRLDYRMKFVGQILAALVVIVYGDVVIRSLPFAGMSTLPSYVAIPVTVFALVGVTNAINLTDGLDGLAGGTTMLSLAAIAVLSYTSGGGFVLLAAASVIGSILGFLRFNTYPARIFMGDGGSQFLGFSTGVLVITLTQQANTALSPALPLLLLGLPIVDTLLVMAERMHEGRSPFTPDRKHIHHRLLALGFDHYEAVFVIYALQAAMILPAYFLRFEADWLIIALYVAFSACVVAFLTVAPVFGWRVHEQVERAGTRHAPIWIGWLRRDQRMLKGAFYAAVVAIPAFFFVGAFFVASVPKDIGALALVLLVALLAVYVRHRHRPFSLFEKGSVYVAGICLVYLMQLSPDAFERFGVYCSVLFVAMSVAVAVGFRVGAERFRVTPMDFLVILIALVVPNVPELHMKVQHLGVATAMIIVLLYSIELVLNNVWRRWDVMRFTTYVTLAVLGVRGLAGA